MSWKGLTVIPRRGKMFGCVNRFHVTASWQKIWVSSVTANKEDDGIGNALLQEFVDRLEYTPVHV